MAERYRKEMEEYKQKFQEINDYINDSRYSTIKKGAEYARFVKEESTNETEIQEARAKQTKLNYSALETDITDLRESLRQTKDFADGTIKMLEDKLV